MNIYRYLGQSLAFTTLLGSLSLLGCMVGPDYKKPELAVPQNWQASPVSEKSSEQQWWQRFNDPILNINWPMPAINLSDKDKNYSFIDNNFKPIKYDM